MFNVQRSTSTEESLVSALWLIIATVMASLSGDVLKGFGFTPYSRPSVDSMLSAALRY
jgi:hypothetical protein